MDTDLVTRAQRGDREAFALLATGFADRFLAVARRILRDIDLAEDATQQALLTVWRDLPQLRDPARFEAWSYRILVRACYAEGRKERRWAPNIRLLPADEPMGRMVSTPSSDRDQLERGFRRLSTRSPNGGGASPLPRPADRTGRRDPRRPDRHRELSTSLRDARAARGARRRCAAHGAGGCPMSTDRDTTRVVRSWLRTDEHESADRVLDAVLDQLDTTPQRRATWWPARRLPEMNNTAKLAFGVAAAAVVIAAFLGIRFFSPARTSADGPTPTTDPDRHSGGNSTVVRRGSTRSRYVDRAPVLGLPVPAHRRRFLSVTFTVPEAGPAYGARGVRPTTGFEAPDGMADSASARRPSLQRPLRLRNSAPDVVVGPTVDDLAAAFAEQTAYEATTPVDVTLGGYSRQAGRPATAGETRR